MIRSGELIAVRAVRLIEELIAVRTVRLIAKKALVVLVIAIGFPGLMLMASAANAQEARTAASMAALKDKTAKLGAPRIEERRRLVTKVPQLCISARPR